MRNDRDYQNRNYNDYDREGENRGRSYRTYGPGYEGGAGAFAGQDNSEYSRIESYSGYDADRNYNQDRNQNYGRDRDRNYDQDRGRSFTQNRGRNWESTSDYGMSGYGGSNDYSRGIYGSTNLGSNRNTERGYERYRDLDQQTDRNRDWGYPRQDRDFGGSQRDSYGSASAMNPGGERDVDRYYRSNYDRDRYNESGRDSGGTMGRSEQFRSNERNSYDNREGAIYDRDRDFNAGGITNMGGDYDRERYLGNQRSGSYDRDRNYGGGYSSNRSSNSDSGNTYGDDTPNYGDFRRGNEYGSITSRHAGYGSSISNYGGGNASREGTSWGAGYDYSDERSRGSHYGSSGYNRDWATDRNRNQSRGFGQGHTHTQTGNADYDRGNYGAESYSRPYDRHEDENRGLLEKASDRVRSWFGGNE